MNLLFSYEPGGLKHFAFLETNPTWFHHKPVNCGLNRLTSLFPEFRQSSISNALISAWEYHRETGL